MATYSMFLPGESQGQGSLVGCHQWGHTESDTTERLTNSCNLLSRVGARAVTVKAFS